MGPPSMNGGRMEASVARTPAAAGFNGAAVDERRKGRRSSRNWSSWQGFNGAAVDERRKA